MGQLAATLAGLAVAASVLLLRPPPRWLLAVRLADVGGRGRGAPGTTTPGRDVLRRLGATRPWWPPVVAGAAAPWLVARPSDALVLATAGGVAAFATAQVVAARARGRRSRVVARVGEGIDLVAVELRAGVPVAVALSGLADDVPELADVAAVARRGGDVAASLEAAAQVPGAQDLRRVAAAWRVADRAGAPVADVLARVAESVRDDRELAREVRAECAPARATGRLMAVLPVFGLGLGSGLGGHPVAVLLGTLPGAVCLAAGAGLACAGTAWVERIARRAEVGP